MTSSLSRKESGYRKKPVVVQAHRWFKNGEPYALVGTHRQEKADGR